MVLRILLYLLLALLVLLFCFRYGIVVSYIDKEFSLKLRGNPFRFGSSRKTGENMGSEETPGGEGKRDEPKAKPDPGMFRELQKLQRLWKRLKLDRLIDRFTLPPWEELPTLAGMTVTSLKRGLRAIELDELMLHLSIGSRDPYLTAMRLNYANLAAEVLLNGGVLKPRKQDVAIWPDFVSEHCVPELRVALSVRLYKLAAAALAFHWSYRRWKKDYEKRTENAERN